MPSVLFVCTGNQFRSPIAAAYLQQLLEEVGLEHWHVGSAGTWTVPAQPRLEAARSTARELGVRLGEGTTCVVDAELLDRHDLILVMERGQREALQIEFPGARDRIHLLSEMGTGEPPDVSDPAGAPDERAAVLRAMLALIRRGLPRILELAMLPRRLER